MSLVFVVAVFIDNFLTYPLIFSNSLKAHPLELFLVVLMAGTLAGIPGMVLGAPAYTVLRIIAREFFTRFDVVRAATRDLGD
jgi:predicted PurR-regulated permease PerM